MLKKLAFLKRIFIPLFLIGGILFLSNSYSLDDNIREYYEKIDEADYLIVKKEYNKALTLFDKAFEYKKIPFARDLYNAGMCALLLNDEKAFNYFEKLAQKGILLESLPTKELITLNKEKYDAFEVKYTEQRKKALTTKNIKLKNEIEIMLEHDQELAKDKEYDKAKRPKFTQLVYVNAQRIIDIINEFGFPNEDIVGIEKPDSGTKLGIILYHYAQLLAVEKFFEKKDSLAGRTKNDFGLDTLNFASLNLMNILKQEVLKGNFSRTKYAQLDEAVTNNKYGLLINLMVDKRVGRIAYNDNEIAAIDIARSEIFLDSHSRYAERVDSLKIIFTDRMSLFESKFKKQTFISDLNGHTFAMFYKDSIDGSNYFNEQLKIYPAMVEIKHK